jgi:hypothetical protein
MKSNFISNILLWLSLVLVSQIAIGQSDTFTIQEIQFKSQGVTLAGSILQPKNSFAAVVIVHGSDPVKREMEFAKRLAKKELLF